MIVILRSYKTLHCRDFFNVRTETLVDGEDEKMCCLIATKTLHAGKLINLLYSAGRGD